MNRAEFMKRLQALLQDIPDAERKEALEFYENYFDDAGIENEQQVISSLGSPEKVANTIKDGLADETGSNGSFTENGYRTYDEPINSMAVKEQPNTKRKLKDRIRGLGTSGLILALILLIFALPILGPTFAAAVSVVCSILVTGVVLVFIVAIIGIILIVIGAVAFASAIGTLIVTPALGVILLGVAFLSIGCGILATILGIWIITKVIPPFIRMIVNFIQRILK